GVGVWGGGAGGGGGGGGAVAGEEEGARATRTGLHSRVAGSAARASQGAAQGRPARPARGRRPREHLRRRGALARTSEPFAPCERPLRGRARAPHARDPGGIAGGHREAGLDPVRLPDTRRRLRVHAGGVPRLRTRRAAVPSLWAGECQGARRRPRDVVLPTLPGLAVEAPRLARVGRTYKTEAVVLRSFRFAEADRVLHLYTSERGRVGAIAKGARKTKSRFGARL